MEPEADQPLIPVSGMRRAKSAELALIVLPLLAGLSLVTVHHKETAWWPDEHVYLMTGARLAVSGRFTFDSPEEDVQPLIAFYHQTEKGDFAPYYPPGFPVLLALVYLLFGPAACYWLNAGLAIVGVWLTYSVGRSLLGGTVGVVAAALLAVNPVYLNSANGIMSGMCATVLVVGSVALVLAGLRSSSARRSLLAVAVAGLLAGSAVLVWLAAAVGVFPALGLLLGGLPHQRRSPWRRRLGELGVFACGVALVGLLLVAYQIVVFGHLASPYVAISTGGFALEHARQNLPLLLTRLASPSSGGLLLPALLGIVILAFRRSKVVATLALWIFPIMILHLFYAVTGRGIGGLRLVLISFPGLAIAAGCFVSHVGRLLAVQAKRQSLVVVAAVTVIGCVVILYLSNALLSDRAKPYPDTGELLRVVSQGAPTGSTILGWRNKLHPVAFFLYGRHELIVINQFPSESSNPYWLGTGKVWRGTMTTVEGGWRRLAASNRDRIGERLESGSRVFVLVNAALVESCATRFARYFETGPISSDSELYALVEVRKKKLSQLRDPGCP